MVDTMRAVVLDAPGPPETLQIRNVPIPQPQTGQVLIQVRPSGSTGPNSTPDSVSQMAQPFPGCSASKPPES